MRPVNVQNHTAGEISADLYSGEEDTAAADGLVPDASVIQLLIAASSFERR